MAAAAAAPVAMREEKGDERPNAKTRGEIVSSRSFSKLILPKVSPAWVKGLCEISPCLSPALEDLHTFFCAQSEESY